MSALIEYLRSRLDDVRQHRDLSRIAADVQVGGWYRRASRIADALGEADSASLSLRLDEIADQLQRMLQSLTALHTSAVFRDIPPRARERTLHPTNLLRNDSRYRKVTDLWRLWERHAAERPLSLEEEIEATQRVCDAMDLFTQLVVCKALLDLEYLCHPGDGSNFSGPLGNATVRADKGATVLELQGAEWARCRLRFVGTITPLVDRDSGDPLRRARQLRKLLDDADTDEGPAIVVHPTASADIQLLAPRDRYLLDHAGTDTLSADDTTEVVPASPLGADSLERVGRIIRQHTFGAALLAYPLTCELSKDERLLLAGFSEADAVLSEDRLTLIEPTGTGLTERVSQSARDEHRRRRSQAVLPGFDGVRTLEARAEQYFATVLRCPTQPCNNDGDSTHFEARSHDTFICRCNSCGTEWGLQSCGECHGRVPFLRPRHEVPDGVRPIDHFGADLLAAPCEVDVDRFVCPTCRVCPNAGSISACERCSPSR